MRKKGKENEAIEEMSAVSPLDFVKPVFSAARFRFLPNELRKRSTASLKVYNGLCNSKSMFRGKHRLD